MAQIRWGTATAGVLDTASNWVGGVAPTGSDDAVFDGEYNGNPTAPASQLTVGNIYVSKAFNAASGGGTPGNMGSAVAPLDVLVGTIHYEGSCAQAYFTGSGDRVIAGHAGEGANALHLGEMVISGGGESVEVVSGRTVIDEGTIKDIHVGGDSNRSPKLEMIGVSHTGDFSMNGGEVDADYINDANFMAMASGILRLDNIGSLPPFTIGAGGRMVLTGTSSLVIDDLNILSGGFLDLSGYKGPILYSGTLRVYSGGIANLDSGKPLVQGGDGVIIASREATVRVNSANTVLRLP